MIRVTKTYTRPNITVKFHNEVLDGTHFRTAYGQTGKRVAVNNTYSEDGLNWYYESFWLNLSMYEEQLNDPICMVYSNDRDVYNNSNGITSTPTVVEEV